MRDRNSNEVVQEVVHQSDERERILKENANLRYENDLLRKDVQALKDCIVKMTLRQYA